MSNPTVRARQKALEDLPEWAKCCRQRIDSISESCGKLEVRVFPSETVQRIVVCQFCGRQTKTVGMRLAETVSRKGYRYGSIAVDCFDFDEGPGEGQANG